MLPFRNWAFGMLALASLPLAASGLTWTTQTVRIVTTHFQTTQVVVFEFKNDSNHSVTILDLQTSCDCLTISADQKTYSPGSHGILAGQFTIGDRIGLYERKITVLTDENDTPTQLHLQIVVPALATLTPQTVAWTAADPSETKTIDVQVAEALTIDFTEIQATSDTFTTRLEMLTAGRHYRLHVTPHQPRQTTNAAIRLIGRDKSGHDIVVSAYANVP